MDPLPERGHLEENPLPHLLLRLRRARFSGTLKLSRERLEKSFQLHGGIPVFAESNRASESLGLQLVDAGSLSRDDYAEVVSYVQREGCKEGTALLALELVEPKQLFLALKEQVRLRLLECFGWPRGEFSLDATEAPPADAQPFRSDLYALIQEGLEIHWSAERILADLAQKTRLYPTRSHRFARIWPRLSSDAGVEALLEALDGGQPLWKVLRAASTPRALAAAWVLDVAKALDYREALQAAPRPGDGADAEIEIVVDSAAEPTPVEAGPAVRAATGERTRVRDSEADALRREIAAKFGRLGNLSHYELLGVEADADLAALKSAYLAAAKTFHPDALARSGLDAKTREQASKVFAEIGKAYAVISDPATRREYDAQLGNEDAALDADRLANAERLYRKGEILLRQGNFKGALEFLRPAVNLWPDDGTYQSAVGWALYKKMPSEPDPARTHLERASELEPDNGVIFFRLSVVLRALGQADAASAALARARYLDPEAEGPG
jgi:tetratricopeptide (TPR) repeat protein